MSPPKKPKKTEQSEPKPKQTRNGLALNIWLPTEHRKYLDRLSEEEYRSVTALVVMAVDLLARERGHEIPKPPPPKRSRKPPP